MLPPSRSTPRPRTILLALAAVGLATALTACDPLPPDPSPSPSVVDTPTPTAETDEPTPEPTSTTPSGTVDPALVENVRDAIASGNTAALEGYFTDPVRVVIAASEADDQLSPVDAVLSLDYVGPGVGTWDFALPEATVDGYRTSVYYADYFPEDVIVGRSSEGPVVAFSPAGDGIDTVFMSIDEDLLFY
ncbi:hypothetical protein [Protaetiibacter intestinalis]|uniref:Uncharacterized protein n=1 Tax=Protaetiibacter intestinalis TaxID=2419774 RepID=A0A387B8K1_9MICO|nr:hypothetical protein [Protaetiibacter intestinalis]AYF98673.1 hypothetical protein D7I47_10680 [Protaetiibacter intestinalis]